MNEYVCFLVDLESKVSRFGDKFCKS